MSKLPNQQDKCECKHKLHDIEGEPCPLWDVRAYLRNGKKVMLCGDCKTDTDVLVASSPRQEAWAERFKKLWKRHPIASFVLGEEVQAFIRQELTTLHKADCERFRGMIGEDENTLGVHPETKSIVQRRNELRAELRTALQKFEEEK